MSFLFLITPVQSTGGPIITNRNQFGINVYLISVFYFMSAFNKEIVTRHMAYVAYCWTPLYLTNSFRV